MSMQAPTGNRDRRRWLVASGAIVLHTVAAENGQVMQATVVRVHFAAG